MKVSEVIELLSKVNPDYDVYVETGMCIQEVEDIEINKSNYMVIMGVTK